MSDWMKDTTATVQNARLRSLADIQIGVRRIHRPIILAQSKERRGKRRGGAELKKVATPYILLLVVLWHSGGNCKIPVQEII